MSYFDIHTLEFRHLRQFALLLDPSGAVIRQLAVLDAAVLSGTAPT